MQQAVVVIGLIAFALNDDINMYMEIHDIARTREIILSIIILKIIGYARHY